MNVTGRVRVSEPRGDSTSACVGLRPRLGHASVGFDNRAAMRMLADKVIQMGHDRIAVISGIVEGNDRASGTSDGIKDSWQSPRFRSARSARYPNAL